MNEKIGNIFQFGEPLVTVQKENQSEEDEICQYSNGIEISKNSIKQHALNSLRKLKKSPDVVSQWGQWKPEIEDLVLKDYVPEHYLAIFTKGEMFGVHSGTIVVYNMLLNTIQTYEEFIYGDLIHRCYLKCPGETYLVYLTRCTKFSSTLVDAISVL